MAKKKAGIARRTISIPSDLDARMSKFVDVNWSSVAKLAFEAKLGSLSQPKVSKEMADVIARLKASKATSDSVDYKDGFESGQKWAREFAEAFELQRLERLQQKLESNRLWSDWFAVENGDGNAAGLREAIFDEPSNWRDAEEFFCEACGATGEQVSQPEYLRGFAEGALNVWDNVKDQL